MIVDIVALVMVLINLPALVLILIIVSDMILWIITNRLMLKWLDQLLVKTDYNYEVEFGKTVMAGFATWIPGIILLIDQIRTKSFRNYIQSMKNKSLKTLLFR